MKKEERKEEKVHKQNAYCRRYLNQLEKHKFGDHFVLRATSIRYAHLFFKLWQP